MTIQEDMQRRYIGKRVIARDNADVIGRIRDIRIAPNGAGMVIIDADNGMDGVIPIHLAEIINDALPLPG